MPLHESGHRLEQSPQPAAAPSRDAGLAITLSPGLRLARDQLVGGPGEPLEFEGSGPTDRHNWRDLAEQRRVLKRPVRVADAMHDREPAFARQVLDELQRPLHAASALRRET